MKTNQTMMLALLGAAACSFFFGLGQHEAPAAQPFCQNSCCEIPYGWWINGIPGGTQCYSAQVTGATWPFKADGTDNTFQAFPSIFVTVPTNQGCKLVATGATYDRWIWPDFTGCQNTPSPEAVLPNTGINNMAPTKDPASPINQNKCGS